MDATASAISVPIGALTEVMVSTTDVTIDGDVVGPDSWIRYITLDRLRCRIHHACVGTGFVGSAPLARARTAAGWRTCC